MPSSEPVTWHPISRMPLVAGMIDTALGDTSRQIHLLSQARVRPHLLDDATIDRVESIYREQLAFVDIYAEQIQRWRAENPSAAQHRKLDRLDEQNRCLRQITTEILALAVELRKGTIDRIMERSDLELGLQALLGKLPPRRT
jgi:hypothetical protein